MALNFDFENIEKKNFEHFLYLLPKCKEIATKYTDIMKTSNTTLYETDVFPANILIKDFFLFKETLETFLLYMSSKRICKSERNHTQETYLKEAFGCFTNILATTQNLFQEIFIDDKNKEMLARIEKPILNMGFLKLLTLIFDFFKSLRVLKHHFKEIIKDRDEFRQLFSS